MWKDQTDDELRQAMDVAETIVKCDAGGIKELRKWLSSDQYRNRPISVTQMGGGGGGCLSSLMNMKE